MAGAAGVVLDEPSWRARLVSLAAGKEATPAERLRRTGLTVCVAAIVVLSCIWVGTYLALGLTVPALIPLGYQVVSVLSLAVYLRTKWYAPFRASQLALMLALPFLLQWSIGGFAEASAVALWAFVSPLGALVFHGPRQALPWFAGFVCLLAATPFVERAFPGSEGVGPTAQAAFFVMNFLGPLGVSFVVLEYFVRARDREHERSEGLLRAILPGPIAERLKAGGGVIADRYEAVTVVFADLVGFTAAAAQMPPDEVVAVLDEVVTTFDHLVERHGLEKIKTIGDGYMAAAGVPTPRPDHARAAAELALAMQAAVAGFAAARRHGLSLRIGLATGPVVAGVIGRTKFGYDLWGDTVNTASRMESHAPPAAIQATQETAALLEGAFRLERREVEVRGKGRMPAYLLLGRA